jgi:hypothetical protein
LEVKKSTGSLDREVRKSSKEEEEEEEEWTLLVT